MEATMTPSDLARCDNCGRYGWHETNRCPEFGANPFPHIPLPPGASTDSWGWEQNLQQPGYSRSLTWASYGPADGISVDIDGRQESDGSFTRNISVWGLPEGEGMSSAQALALAAMLINASEELDRWAQ
jgi:hypothetical protein